MSENHSPTSFTSRRGRRRLFLFASVILVAALVVTGISRTQGTKAQHVTLDDPHVWAVRSGSTSFYGDVNTEIAELSSIHTGNSTNFPVSGVLQYGNSIVLYSNQSLLPLNPAKPVDVSPQDILPSKPLGADVIDSSGPYAVFLNRSSGDLGGITIAELADGKEVASINKKIDDGQREHFLAATITDDGLIYAVDNRGQAISHRLDDGKRSSLAKGIDIPDNAVSTSMTVFADNHWAVLARTENESLLWIDGKAVSIELTGSVALARPYRDADELLVADDSGLHFFDTGTNQTNSIDSDALKGSTPAPPLWDGECSYAAWSTGAAMSASLCGEQITSLNTGEGGAGGNPDPSFRINGSHIILNDAGSGLVWTLNDGVFTLVASSVQWQKDSEQTNADQAPQNKDAQSNECPMPAQNAQAEFGVRPGLSTSIPVLVSAQDPNPADTITIIPSDASPRWDGDSGLGDLSLTNNNQSVVLKPNSDGGSARFSYTITDGASECSVSASATVSVHPDDVRSVPEFRAENSDALKHLQAAPGTSVRFNGLAGWVDPDGDSIYISSVTASTGSVAATADGTVAYQPDNDQAAGNATITVNVSDSHGDGTASHTYTVKVSDAPTLHARSLARTVPAGTTQTIDLSEYVSGVTLEDVSTARVEIDSASVETESQASDISIQTNTDATSLTVTPITEGIFPITYKVSSGNSQATGTLLVNSHKAAMRLSVPPVTAFVRPDEDVTINPLELASNPKDSVLIVKEPEVSPVENAGLKADVIAGASLRITGQTPNGQAGQVGTISYTVTDGESTTTGQVTVFELDENMSTKPVTAPDQVTVRAGEQMDVPVLDNDVPAAGTNLVLDPTFSANDDIPGLAFASDRTLRYLAPDSPGYYTLFYRAYAPGHSDEASEGRVTVHVTPKGENRPPNADNVSGRVEAHNSTLLDAPTFGADPDGDDTFVTSVTQPAKNGFTSIAPDGRIRVISTKDTGPIEFEYTLSDSNGLTSKASVRVGVIEDVSRSPIAYNDYVEVKPGAGTVTVNPALNDTPVAGQTLVVDKVEVKPANLSLQTEQEGATGEGALKAKIGKDNAVTLEVPDTPGRVVYRYSLSSVSDDEDAKDVADTSKAEGMIVVNITDQAQPIYPIVHDSIIGTNDIKDESFSVDVLANKTVWSGGELRTQLLSENSSTVSMSNTKMSGDVSNRRQTIPFSVTGIGEDNKELTTWAFVKVPQLDNIQPELLDSSRTFTVDQGKSISIDLEDEIRPFSNRSVQVLKATSSGTRQGAKCSVSGNTVTYAAGDAPLGSSDACHVTVQWKGYKRSATNVSLPIRIILKDPPPVINSRQIAVVDPGESTTYDLTQAVTWPGENKSRLSFACDSPTGTSGVSVRCEGTRARIEVSDSASQGTIATFGVRVISPSFDSGVPEGRLSVQVGTLAPLALNPTGTTLTVNAGQSVTTDDLVALNRSLPHRGDLSLTPGSVRFSGGLSGTINGGRVIVTAPTNIQGGVKTGSVRLQDSQGNSGSIPITVNVNARPNQPSIESYSAGDGEVGILIRDNATASVPPVQGYTMTWSGRGGSGSKQCDAGVCRIDGLRNYETITVSVTATNAQGNSTPATLSTWAYAPPAAPTVTFDEPLTDGQGKITVKAGDSSANQIAVYVGNRCDQIIRSSQTITVTGLPSGKKNATQVYAQAINETGPPPTIQQVDSGSGKSNTVLAYSVGRPELGSLTYNTTSDSGVNVSLSKLETGGDGIDWYWTVNGKQYGNVQHSTGKQSVVIPASALKQNQENTIGIKAFSTDDGKRVSGAESELTFKVTTYQFPSSGENVTYSYDSNASADSFELHNTTSADGTYTAKLAETPNPSTCTAKIRWVYNKDKNRVSNLYEIRPAKGSPCYAVNVQIPESFEDWTIGSGSSKWNPTIYNLPKNTNDYDIELLVSYAGTTDRFKATLLSDGTTVEFKDPKGKDVVWNSAYAPYTVKLNIRFKNNLANVSDITKTITVS